MSLQSVTSIHDVSVLVPTDTKAVNMENTRTYAVDATRPLKARVCPLDARTQADLLLKSMVVSHKIYFSSDPGEIGPDERLVWRGTVLNVVGPVVDVNGLGRMWIVYADARGRYNEAGGVIY